MSVAFDTGPIRLAKRSGRLGNNANGNVTFIRIAND